MMLAPLLGRAISFGAIFRFARPAQAAAVCAKTVLGKNAIAELTAIVAKIDDRAIRSTAFSRLTITFHPPLEGGSRERSDEGRGLGGAVYHRGPSPKFRCAN